MASEFSILGLISLSLALVLAAISFLAPYWVTMSAPSKTMGLWADCEDLGVDLDLTCKWFHQDDFQWEKQREIWFKVVQGMFGFGVFFLLLAFICALVNLCCGGFSAITYSISGILMLAFMLLGVALAVYGGKQHNERRVVVLPNDGNLRFGWAMWLGAAAALFTLLASFCYTMLGCRTRHYDGYKSGQVV